VTLSADMHYYCYSISMVKGIKELKRFSLFGPGTYVCVLYQLPPQNPGFNPTPFKFTKYSNAYMLVYIRDSDKDKVICPVDEKDIAEHLQVHSSLELEVGTYIKHYQSFFVNIHE
jgi:hypothetical protein